MSVPPEDLDYYHRRAEAQLELAQKTDLSAAVAAHVAIAERYLDQCEPAREREAPSNAGAAATCARSALSAIGATSLTIHWAHCGSSRIRHASRPMLRRVRPAAPHAPSRAPSETRRLSDGRAAQGRSPGCGECEFMGAMQRVLVSGRVQQVGYRDYMVRQARASWA